MNFYFHFLIFFLILFLYIHIIHQYKRSEDLEIYEMDYSSNAHLQEVCDIKQPVLFEYKSILPKFYETVTYDDLLADKYSNYDIRVKETDDYWKSDSSVDYIVLSYSSGTNLMKSDPKSAYFTENNEEFIEESGLTSLWQLNDENLKPNFTVQTKYDIILGSRGAVTPLRYHTNFRNYISVNSGKIQVKMTPFKSTKYLYQNKDFETYEFRSPINVWKPQDKFRTEMNKIKFLEFDVIQGFVLSIPPYWWYSIKFDKGEDTLISAFTYNTVMNTVSNVPYFAKYYIQQSNIKKRIAKVISFEEPSETIENVEKNDDTIVIDITSKNELS
jgi:hypothetical protein